LTGLRRVLNDARERHFGMSNISSMALYRSIIDSAGAKYVELHRWSFGGL
jgi:2'-5' RNA ligase